MGVIAASGTITQLIPPSLVLIVLADQLGRSVGDMYAGAIGPSLIQIGLFCGLGFHRRAISGRSRSRRCRRKRRTLKGWALWKKCLRGIIPSLGLIFLVLGTIFVGLATPTEARRARRGRARLSLAAANRTPRPGRSSTRACRRPCASPPWWSIILIGARMFSLVFQGVGGKEWIEHLLISLPGGQIGFLIFVNVFIFLIAFFLDFFEIAFIIIPLLAPAADKLGIDLIWFGVLICANIQTSFMHPPFGFALFYLRRIAPPVYIDRVSGIRMAPVTTGQIYWGAMPFVVLQCIAVALVIACPALVMHYMAEGSKIDPSKIEFGSRSPTWRRSTSASRQEVNDRRPIRKFRTDPGGMQTTVRQLDLPRQSIRPNQSCVHPSLHQ